MVRPITMATIGLLVLFGCGPQSVDNESSDSERDASEIVVSVETAMDTDGAAVAERPNVVFILTDDLGWSDTTLYGTTSFYETPNMERLANRGMRFTNAYTAYPTCSPTRASIMTGLSPGRLGFTRAIGHVDHVVLKARMPKSRNPSHKALTPTSVTRFDTEFQTLAETLKEAGYATGHFGKWHLGQDPYSPLDHGFDIDLPHGDGRAPRSYVAPWKFLNKNEMDFEPNSPNEHFEERMADEAAAFMEQNKDQPFFVNYWSFSVHGPLSGKQELVTKYAEKADPNNPQRNPVYGAMVESLDDAVGTILDTLDRLKLSEKTIIVLYSDNGADTHSLAGGIPPTSSAPLRDGKASIYEGGTRVPCAVVWPGKTKPGSQTDALLTSMDWYPTLLEMLQIETDLSFDGVSQVSTLLGKSDARDSICCHVPQYYPSLATVPSTYLRRGDWKLIRFHCDGDKQSDRFELYNLRDDLGEATDLAEQFPDRVQAMNQEITEYLTEIEAIVPVPNPNYLKERTKRWDKKRINGHLFEPQESSGIQEYLPFTHSPKCDLPQCTLQPVSDSELSDILGELDEILN